MTKGLRPDGCPFINLGLKTSRCGSMEVHWAGSWDSNCSPLRLTRQPRPNQMTVAAPLLVQVVSF